MNKLNVIEKSNQRVLTSAQLAEVFGTDNHKISYNFNYNKNRYEEGKHYFLLQGDDLKDFKTEHEIHDSLKRVHTIYLWAEKGAFLHAKSLNTDQAWNAYSQLVDDYFKKVEESKQNTPNLDGLSPQLQFMIQTEQRQNALEARQDALENSQREFAEGLTAVPDPSKAVNTVNEYARWTRLGHNEIYNKVYDILKNQHGIDVRQRVANERERIQEEHNEKTGKWYAESTLKSKVNGVDVMVRIGCLDKFQSILSGLLAKEKIKNTLSVV